MGDGKMTGSWSLNIKPRTWQNQAMALWRQSFKGIVEVVTGAGKTVFAEMCILAFNEIYPRGRYLIIVPTRSLIDQWYVSLMEDLGASQDQIAVYSGDNHPKEANTLNIMVINTAREVAHQISADNDVFLIADECHRLGSPQNAKALKGLYRAALGLSATPEREYDKGLESYVKPVLGDIIFRYTYAEAKNDNIISAFRLDNVKAEFLDHERIKYEAYTRRIAALLNKQMETDEYIERLLRERASISAGAAMRIPLAIKIVEEQHEARCIVFHERVDAANKMLEIMRKRRINATIYHTKINPTLRRDNLRLFRQGVFDVLICCRALDEGINVPEANVAVIASSTASIRQRIQRLGRIIRSAPGKHLATVYTIYITRAEELRLRKEAQGLGEITKVVWHKGGVTPRG
jgi:superfamily II DNA or RNA helicase